MIPGSKIQISKLLSGRALTALLALLISLGITPPLAHAHQQKIAFTTVLFNANSGNIEVMHRFSLHDAEHAVKKLFDKNADILNDEKTQDTFSQYVADTFSLTSSPDKIAPLETIGYEVAGKNLWIYQETPIPDRVSTLTISNAALQDIWPDQINRVNIERNGKTTTLVFDGSISTQQASVLQK